MHYVPEPIGVIKKTPLASVDFRSGHNAINKAIAMNQVAPAFPSYRNEVTTSLQINPAKAGKKLMMKGFEWRVLATQQEQFLNTLDQSLSCIK